MTNAIMTYASPISLKGPANVAHGWMFIGFAINVLLLGVMVTQVYIYYTTYKKDKLWMKAFVAGLFLADTSNTIFDFIYLYRSLITFFGDDAFLSVADWVFATDPALTGIIAACVQLFFAWRILILTKTWYYSAVIAAMAITGGAAGIVTAFNVTKTPRFVDFHNFKQTVIVWLAAEAVGDVLITSVLVWFLYRKHKTGFKRSDMMVDRIIRVTIQTGLLTMIVATLDLIFFLIDPTGTHLLFNFPLCKLYSNTLMSSLNSRSGWKYNGHTTSGDSEGQIISASNLKQNRRNTNIKLDNARSFSEVFVRVEQHELREVTPGTVYDEKTATLGGSEHSIEAQMESK